MIRDTRGDATTSSRRESKKREGPGYGASRCGFGRTNISGESRRVDIVLSSTQSKGLDCSEGGEMEALDHIHLNNWVTCSYSLSVCVDEVLALSITMY